ncbi:MAG: hypothetical protein V1859_06930 [archaeon]
MIESLFGGAIGAYLGLLLGKYSYEKVLQKKYPAHILKDANSIKYHERCKFLHGFAGESLTLITESIYLIDQNLSENKKERLRNKKLLEQAYSKLSCYYGPLQKIYLSDTGLEKYAKNILSQARQLYFALSKNNNFEKEERVGVRSALTSAIESYEQMSKAIADSSTILWI